MCIGSALDAIEAKYPVLSVCPFCQGKTSPNSHWGKCWVECHDCGARGPKFSMNYQDAQPGFERAIMGWDIGAGKSCSVTR